MYTWYLSLLQPLKYIVMVKVLFLLILQQWYLMWLIWMQCKWWLPRGHKFWFNLSHSASAKSGQRWSSFRIAINCVKSPIVAWGQNSKWMHWMFDAVKGINANLKCEGHNAHAMDWLGYWMPKFSWLRDLEIIECYYKVDIIHGINLNNANVLKNGWVPKIRWPRHYLFLEHMEVILRGFQWICMAPLEELLLSSGIVTIRM